MFQLARPTPAQPYIKVAALWSSTICCSGAQGHGLVMALSQCLPAFQGLLDPCTNSLAAPNIPAEVLYDKKARCSPPVPHARASSCKTCQFKMILVP